MPLFEYACQSCAKSVELLIRNSQEVPTCPDCGSEQMTKLISAPAAPAVRSGSGLPVARAAAEAAAACPAMRCCGGGCQPL